MVWTFSVQTTGVFCSVNKTVIDEIFYLQREERVQFLLNLFKAKSKNSPIEFKAVLNCAKKISSEDIKLLINSLAKKKQLELIGSISAANNSHFNHARKGEDLFFNIYDELPNGKLINSLFNELDAKDKKVDLKTDMVFAWPWERKRLSTCSTYIGRENAWGEWKEDPLNHFIILWEPFGFSWVKGGNHSISIGVLREGGKLSPREYYDVSPLFDHIYTDGLNYYFKETDKAFSKVYEYDFALIFELGRIMHSREANT